jgi:protein-L-isoaspartate(D-aspartate) O-methyltransferase
MKTKSTDLQEWIGQEAEPFGSIDDANLDGLMERIGDARVVLIGEASHGTSEFYRMRQKISATLIRRKDFRMIGIEGDWPDVEHVDDFVRQRNSKEARPREAFSRFPTWMWRNEEVLSFVDWLQEHNAGLADRSKRVAMHGLDLYSMYASIHEVIEALDREGDAELAESARQRYSGLLAYEPEPQDYGRAVHYAYEKGQEAKVTSMLCDLLAKRMEAASQRKEAIFDAEQNARVVASAEEYYRSMFRGGRESWNLRDSHMFETLQELRRLREPDDKMIVWAHNSHIGDARYTEMGRRGEHNIGQLCAEAYGDKAYRIGFGTHTGTVAAAFNWGQPVEIMSVNPSMEKSHERACHDSRHPNFLLPLRGARTSEIGRTAKYERAIGVIYRAETEFASHYFEADLPGQFDEYVWFEESRAVTPLSRERAPKLPERHPFAIID